MLVAELFCPHPMSPLPKSGEGKTLLPFLTHYLSVTSGVSPLLLAREGTWGELKKAGIHR
jgi:hypothetical protein